MLDRVPKIKIKINEDRKGGSRPSKALVAALSYSPAPLRDQPNFKSPTSTSETYTYMWVH